MTNYLTHLRSRNLSPLTIEAYGSDLRRFFAFVSPKKAKRADVVGFLASLQVSPRTVARYLNTIREYYKYEMREGRLKSNPTLEIRAPKAPKRLPRVLSEKEIKDVMLKPDISTPEGIRDRAMLETLYATGIRVSELTSLTEDRIYFDKELIKVLGKGSKERIIPITMLALEWIKNHLKVNSVLFPYTRQLVFDVTMKYAGVSPHKFRHSCATHLLNAGMPILNVSRQLGHESIATTQIYTHVSVNDLQDSYRAAHPKA